MRISRALVFVILLISYSLFTFSLFIKDSNTTIYDVSKAQRINHVPILIASDADFLSYNFPGNGTKINPYLINNLSIITNDAQSAIEIRNTDLYFKITNCELRGQYGILLENTNETSILDNIISDSFYQGIRVTAKGQILISNNDLTNDGITIVSSSGNLTISNNEITNGEVILSSNSGRGNFVLSNLLSGSTLRLGLYGDNYNVSGNYIYQGGGLILNEANNNVIHNNTIFQASNGISIDSSSNYNYIFNNSIIETYNNAIFVAGNNNNISHNLIADSTMGAVMLGPMNGQWPKFNLLSKNTIIDNISPQALDDGASNTFNETYWSDWSDKSDIDQNGFLDDPYPISGTALNYDYYPSTIPYHIYEPSVTSTQSSLSDTLSDPANHSSNYSDTGITNITSTDQEDFLKPQLNSPSDVIIEYGVTDKFIEWNAEDENPNFFEITKNGDLVLSGIWYNYHPISLYFDEDYEIGEYIYEITVYDTSQNTNHDTVILTVIDPITDSNTTVNLPITIEIYNVIFSLIPIWYINNKKWSLK